MNIISQYARGVIDESTFRKLVEAMSFSDVQELMKDSVGTIFEESLTGERDDHRRVLELKATQIVANVVKSRVDKL